MRKLCRTHGCEWSGEINDSLSGCWYHITREWIYRTRWYWYHDSGSRCDYRISRTTYCIHISGIWAHPESDGRRECRSRSRYLTRTTPICDEWDSRKSVTHRKVTPISNRTLWWRTAACCYRKSICCGCAISLGGWTDRKSRWG